jgi:AraC family transcriptional activator of pobA
MDVSGVNLYFSDMRRSTTRPTKPNAHSIPAYLLYGESLDVPAERLIHVEALADRSALHDWRIRPHRHSDLHQLFLLRDGAVAARLDGHQFHFPAPATITIPPGVVHSFEFEPSTTGLVISFAVGLLHDLAGADSDLLQLLEQPAVGPFEASTLEHTDLWTLGEMLLREFGRSAHGRQGALRGLLAALLANLKRLSVSARPPGTQPAATRELVARFRERIEIRLRHHDALSEYAEALGISDIRLRRACLAVSGRTPAELVQRRLQLEAERQLRYTSMTISQVAYHLGFEDPAYFSRFFSRHCGMSPREFRAREGVENVPSAAS